MSENKIYYTANIVVTLEGEQKKVISGLFTVSGDPCENFKEISEKTLSKVVTKNNTLEKALSLIRESTPVQDTYDNYLEWIVDVADIRADTTYFYEKGNWRKLSYNDVCSLRETYMQFIDFLKQSRISLVGLKPVYSEVPDEFGCYTYLYSTKYDPFIPYRVMNLLKYNIPIIISDIQKMITFNIDRLDVDNVFMLVDAVYPTTDKSKFERK